MTNRCFSFPVILALLLSCAGVAAAQTPMSVPFYGATLRVDLPAEAQSLGVADLELSNSLFVSSVSAAMERLTPVALRVSRICDSLNFSDWLRLRLSSDIVKLTYTNPNERVLATLALMRRQGYNATLLELTDVKKWVFVIEMKQKVYFASAFEKGGRTYTLYDIERGQVKRETASEIAAAFFDGDELLVKKTKPVNLELFSYPTLPRDRFRKTLKWDYDGQPFTLNLELNKNYISYFDEYPQTDLELYFRQPIGYHVEYYVCSALSKYIQDRGLKGEAAVDFLLGFCQKAFVYEDDAKTVRGEHANFCEETLASEKSDCEDRTVLLAALVRSILRYNVVGLEFENHVSLAVEIPGATRTAGTMYQFNGANYISCDPSYIGGKVGDVQPDYKAQAPKRIVSGGRFKVDSREIN